MADSQKDAMSPPPPPSLATSRLAKKWPKVVASADPTQRNESADDDEEEEVGLACQGNTRCLIGNSPRAHIRSLTGRNDSPHRAEKLHLIANEIFRNHSTHEATFRSEMGPILQKTLESFGPHGTFVKGPVQSPKDSVMKSGRWEIEYKWLLRKKPHILAAPLNDRYLQAEDEQEQNFVFREWEPVPVNAEFRLFVANGVLTAISEYMFKLYSPRVITSQHAIRTCLAAYHAKTIAPALGHLYAKYIVDVTIRGFNGSNEADWRPQVLEVNPLVALEAGFSGEALFADEKGKQILMGTTKDVDYPVIICPRD
ncbi:hypothetical protein PILCRDRAFT_4251 [Piloderma croceum F 1598]|uniref:Uncharacterized protein n=1 Tax=Piloderma croceum (strain F 1598) TaxID=765440 RepID=A0A0C3G5A6_PILCF|nr:hypothetical protein PILCRDRAFT_4251 [Piloderma croceum F 1598]